MKLRSVLWTSVLAAAFFTVACGGGPSDGPDTDIDVLKSDKQRISNPDVPDADLEELAAGNTAFAIDLFARLRGESDGNIFFSPFSISIALSMTYAGARTSTETEMAQTLQFTLGQEGLHPAFNRLDLELASRETPPDEYADDGFKLRIANSIWGQRGYPFENPFLDTLALNYGAGLRILDFGTDPEGSREVINQWVEEKTEDKIQDLLPAGSITELTRLVLTNAIYFKAAWNDPFEEADTTAGAFTLRDGSTVEVQMMHQVEMHRYASGPGYQAVSLPYDGALLDMVLIVPDGGTYDEFEAGLSPEVLEEILAGLQTKLVTLSMPKFSFDFGLSLKKVLQAMGMTEAFTFQSDFTGMTTAEQVLISDVIHKAFVGVNEAGTEAAAATAVVVAGSGMPEEVELSADRPFLFLIRDIPTNTILFLGSVVDPSA